MDFDYFEGQGDTAVQNQEIQSPKQYQQAHQGISQNNQDDQFDFGQTVQPQSSYMKQSESNYQQDQGSRRIREEEEKIQQRLREKANLEYQQKQKRKEAGRQQLQDFLEEKEKQKAQRREQNLEQEKRTRENTKKLNEEAGWKKVGANVPLKQGEYPGKKDTNRMRQAIINKRSDELH